MTFTEESLATLDWLELSNIALNDDLAVRTPDELLNLMVALGKHADDRKATIKRLKEESRALDCWRARVEKAHTAARRTATAAVTSA